MVTIRCEVVAEKVWYSKECRYLTAGEVVEFPAEVKNHEGTLTPFKVGDSFRVVNDAPAEQKKAKKPTDDLV